MWEQLSTSQFAQWVTISPFAYPTFLTAHGLGMAVVVGLTTMIGLRVLGFPRQVPLASYVAAVPVGIIGFVVNALSGVALFVADAVTLVQNPSFIIKLIAIVIGLVVLVLFYRGPLKAAVHESAAGRPEYQPTTRDKVLAVLVILVWAVAVIVSGRLIAYLTPEM